MSAKRGNTLVSDELPLSDDAPHLLIVDDDTRIRNLLSQYLTGSGFRITVAANADEARAVARNPVPFLDSLPFHFLSSPACPSTRHTLDGLTATISASSIMKVNRR